MNRRSSLVPTGIALFLAASGGAFAGTVQIDVSSLLNVRTVITYDGNNIGGLVQGVDGSEGFATCAAATKMGNNNGNCMNDNGFYPADATHPDIQLNYTNSAGSSMQAFKMNGGDTASFAVTPGNYKYLALFGTSSSSYAAPSGDRLSVSPKYKVGTGSGTSAVFPDWYPGTTSSSLPNLFVIASNQAKWSGQNMAEPANHSVFGYVANVDSTKILTRVSIKLSDAGYGGGYFTFWGAVAQTAAPTGLAEANGGSSISLRELGSGSVELQWPTGVEGRWTLLDLQGKMLSHGTGSVVTRISTPRAGTLLLQARAGREEKVFRLLSDGI